MIYKLTVVVTVLLVGVSYAFSRAQVGKLGQGVEIQSGEITQVEQGFPLSRYGEESVPVPVDPQWNLHLIKTTKRGSRVDVCVGELRYVGFLYQHDHEQVVLLNCFHREIVENPLDTATQQSQMIYTPFMGIPIAAITQFGIFSEPAADFPAEGQELDCETLCIDQLILMDGRDLMKF